MKRQLWLLYLAVVVAYCGVIVVEQHHNNNNNNNNNNNPTCPDHIVGMLITDGLSATCEFQQASNEYFFAISWHSPPANMSQHLEGYVVYIKSATSLECTNITTESTRTEVFAQEGLRKGENMSYAVVARMRTSSFGGSGALIRDVQLTNAGICPIYSKVKSLPNEVVPPGSSFSFRCEYEGLDSVPAPTLLWLFSTDRKDCARHTIMLKNSTSVRISPDNRVVTILKAKPEHEGCYILSVEYEDTSLKHIRLKGYLELTPNPPHPKEGGVSALAETISVVLGGLVLIGFAVAAAMRVRCVRQKIALKVSENEEASKKVYVCHCTEEDDEAELNKFLGILKSFNIEVIIDMDSSFERSLDNYSLQIVKESMAMADKILVLLSPSFMSSLARCSKCSGTVTVCRTHTELKFISTMLYGEGGQLNKESVSPSTQANIDKELVIVSKDVKPRNFPSLLSNKPYLSYPVRVTMDPDEDCDEDMRRIMCALLETEPEKLKANNGYINL